MMRVSELRQLFLDFFIAKNHKAIPSASLIPVQDDSLLFTNAGMVPFKEVFLGVERRDYVRATSAQRCIRAGGKHNDLENVGYTARHHTFFEMLGNFSFGDYFKAEAIRFAWEFLTVVLKIPAEKLWVTVYLDDDEAADIWLKQINVSPTRFSRCGEDNFWSMGDTGPCGPCTEIFYDHGPGVPGGPPGSPDADGDRYVEIWNLVFMQFNRAQDGTLMALPQQSVDTGMGLERLAAVMQGVQSNYQIDLFQALINAAADCLDQVDRTQPSLYVIADHIRSCSFLIMDGILPSNEGRGYVLRRIIRRALRHAQKLHAPADFFASLVGPLVQQMQDAYPQLARQQAHIEKILITEEKQFIKTLDQGLRFLEAGCVDANVLNTKIIPGDLVFKLYDTYGFPIDLTADIAREKGLTLDLQGFEVAMQAQRDRARQASQFSVDYETHRLGTTQFLGYEHVVTQAMILHIIKDGHEVDQLQANETGMLVLNQTVFYAESGGQVGDQGLIISENSLFEVNDTIKSGGAFLHQGTVSRGILKIGDAVQAEVNILNREAIKANHSATHLLQAALKTCLGDHIMQKGSLVNADRLRFDFSHYEALTQEQLTLVEQCVNAKIRENSIVHTHVMQKDDAVAAGAIALFGEKYEDSVRVLKMADNFSVELCGGTHVSRLGDIGLIHLISESGIASGVRRIEALTGAGALAWFKASEEKLTRLMALVKGDRDSVILKTEALLSNIKTLEKINQQHNIEKMRALGQTMLDQALQMNGITVIVRCVDEMDQKNVRELIEFLKNKLKTAVILLGFVENKQANLVAAIKNAPLKAGELIKQIAVEMGAQGGGKAELAFAGGGQLAKMEPTLTLALACIDRQIKAHQID